jgi:hypothetical protein
MGKPQYWRKGQLTWTQLPQGFKNSPTIFGTALASNLKAFSVDLHGHTLFQYIDDLLLAGLLGGLYRRDSPLSFLWEAGYKVFWKKAQIYQNTIKYLGFHLLQGQCSLGPEREQVICSIPAPKTHLQIREFWGSMGFCQIWIPNYSLLAKPLYKATKWGEQKPLVWK